MNNVGGIVGGIREGDMKMKLTKQERLRVNLGMQCPECSNVNVEENGQQHARSFLCTDCGCQWDREYYDLS